MVMLGTNYQADNYSDPMPETSNSSSEVVRIFAFTIPAVGLAQNDTIKLCPIPGTMGVILVDFDIELPDIDTGGTALRLEVGDDSNADAFVATAQYGTSAGRIAYQLNGVAGALPISYTVADNLILTVQTGPTASATSGTIKGWLKYVQFGVGPAV